MARRAHRLIGFSPWVVWAGVVTLLVGLAWDAILHSLDPELASREGIFTLTNPGHVLFGGGVAIIVAGVLMFFAGKALTASRPLAYALPAVAMAAVAAMSLSLAAATGTLGGPGHSHEEGAVHSHDDGSVHSQDIQAGSVDASNQHVLHDHGEGIAVSAAEVEGAARLVADTKAGASRFQDIKVALSEGYYQVAPPRNGLAHYMNTSYNRDGRILDPEHPESLVYLQMSNGSSRLVGVMYRMPSPDQPGPRVGGALTAWHAHDNLCTANGRVVATSNSGSCPAGTQGGKTPEMLHVWLVENPNGVFSDDMEPAAIGRLLESQASR